MQSKRLSARYARALLELAVETGRLEDIRKQLGKVKFLSDELGVLGSYLSDQKVEGAIRHGAVDEISSSLQLDDTATNFLHILVDRRRFKLFGEIFSLFEEMTDKHTSVVHLNVTTAFPLSEGQKKSLINRFTKPSGGQSILHETIDRSLLVGAKVEVNNKVYDYSIDSRLARLREKLVSPKD